MLNRRNLLIGSAALVGQAAGAHAASGDFAAFLASVNAEAQRQGIHPAILRQALGGLRPNQGVIDLDHRQPEFTLTWARYRASRLSDQRIAAGQEAYRRNQALLHRVAAIYGVEAGVILGIWGLESNYGGYTGGFNVIEALATLAWEGRRARFFRVELLAALHILDHGDISFPRMLGSYAGAMGQPQFMPSAWQRYAVDFDATGRRDIWDNTGDVLASIANYLAQSGWRPDQGWGQAVRLPAGFDAALAGRGRPLPLAQWRRLGVLRDDGAALAEAPLTAAVILPDGSTGEAFLVYPNFAAIRRYNPSDFYALAVGLLGDRIVA